MTKQKINVLITGSNAPGFPSIAKAFRNSLKYNCTLFSCDWADNLKGNKFAVKNFVTPDNQNSNYADEVLKICKNNKIDIVVPIRTGDLVPLSQNLRFFDKNNIIVLLASPDPMMLQCAINKFMLFNYVKFVTRTDVMKYTVAETDKLLIEALDEFKYPTHPVVVKPLEATGSRGFRIVDSKYNQKKAFFTTKIANNPYTNKEILLSTLGKSFKPLLISECLSKPEFSVDVLCYKGKTFAIIPRKRLQMNGGITVKAVVERLSDETITYIKQIIESFGFSYIIGLQIMLNPRTKKYQIIEINPRFQGSTIISIKAGVNIVDSILNMAFEVFNFNYKPKIKYGTFMERCYLELFTHKKRSKSE